jgi:hypothetical protein
MESCIEVYSNFLGTWDWLASMIAILSSSDLRYAGLSTEVLMNKIIVLWVVLTSIKLIHTGHLSIRWNDRYVRSRIYYT